MYILYFLTLTGDQLSVNKNLLLLTSSLKTQMTKPIWIMELSWLASVHNIRTPDETKKLPYLRPPVFVVGTHADQPSADPKAVEAHIKKSISGKSYEKHVIRPFFSVDNTKSSEDSGVQALRQRISEVLKQEPYMGVDLPTKWFNFEKVLRALIEKKIYHLQVSELSTIAKEVCFIDDDEEMMSMLSFYHDLGLIVKHGETVVLQSEWLIQLSIQFIH